MLCEMQRQTHITLVLNGSIDSTVKAILKGSYIICVDGASVALQQHGYIPHELIGDLDSTPAEIIRAFQEGGTKVLRFPSEKNETDGELGLNRALEYNPESISILGLDGGRFDMTIFNLALLHHPLLGAVNTRCYLSDGSTAQLLVPGTEIPVTVPKDGVVSLLPLTDEVVVRSLSGVKWTLTNEKILRSQARTVSNLALGSEPVRCRIDSGRALLIWNS